jgi:hypothetical protein
MSEHSTADQAPLPGGSFRLFITRLSYQAMMSLGILENPITNTKHVALVNARSLIDDLIMLQDKTSGNLDPDEYEHMEKIIRDLEHVYGQIEQAEPSTEA